MDDFEYCVSNSEYINRNVSTSQGKNSVNQLTAVRDS